MTMRFLLLTIVLALLLAAPGCCARCTRPPERSEVFAEVTRNAKAETATVDLVVRLSLKTRLPGYFVIEPRHSLVGRPGYPFVLTIDGQTVTWREDGRVENLPKYDAHGISTPEGGAGRGYTLEKTLSLTPGTHDVKVGMDRGT